MKAEAELEGNRTPERSAELRMENRAGDEKKSRHSRRLEV